VLASDKLVDLSNAGLQLGQVWGAVSGQLFGRLASDGDLILRDLVNELRP
jgi:hypothetical protein